MSEPILSVRDLSVVAQVEGTTHTIVDQVSFDLQRGEILGLVGESGSGKSMTSRALIRLLQSSRLSVSGGSAILKGEDIFTFDERAMRDVRGGSIGMIFQNPSSHLDPVMSIGKQIAESIRFHKAVSRKEARGRAVEILRQVGIPDPERRYNAYAHEFSGGMRQRAMIAVALACDPDILIADEPTTALDVTVQAQILKLLTDLRDTRGVSIIFITHDLGIVSQICDRVAVMYGGRIVELGGKREVIGSGRHPYTAGLVACQPAEGHPGERVRTINGQPPRIGHMPAGCRFHPRCPRVDEWCSTVCPDLVTSGPGHQVACHHPIPHTPAEAAT
ncbi:oligopeptide/dipeptide ABC transporter ATP-binding protein [Roseibium marinum]|uniref:Oligopeptide/dipeptide ABC transporter ATP-binding protein n=1 Tax=Roseibium marinum TaxID=281252 RepID=A0A2S3UJW4_9HYPH|nr:ABC transporter ATP-binding protein [Roseibium marinum]POF28008.1 oligopeptide/dipeptide ABC transporter ATP-binding protein [Roseibium marinum]